MAEGANVGSIYLDLIVKDTVQKQVAQISAKAQNGVKRSFGAVENAASGSIGRAVAQMGKLTSKAAASVSNSAQRLSSGAQKAGQQIEASIGGAFNKSVALAQAKVNQLETSLAAVTAKLKAAKMSDNDAAAQRLGVQQEAIYDRLAAARERLSIQIQAVAQKEATVEEAAAQRTAMAHSSSFSAIGAAGRAAYSVLGASASAFRSLASRAFSGAVKAGKGLWGVLSGIRKRFAGAGKSAHHFGVRLKGIISSALFFNILSRGLTNIVKYMGSAMRSSEELQDALANLKGAAATAAAPLIDALVPALTALANGAATAMSYLSRFASNLTGKSVASMSAAAKKIKITADAAKKATAGFDEIEKLGDSNSKAKEPNYDFQGQSSMMDSALQAVQNGDWGQIGQILAQKVNGIVESVDWAALGEKVANALIAIPKMAIGFILGTDWAQLGQSISEGLISTMNGLTSWIQSVDWVAVGDQIATFVKNIDWGCIATSAFELLGSAIGAAGALIWGAIDEAVASIGDYFTGKIEECGGNVVGGLFKGIGDCLVNIGHWIEEHVFNPIISGIKEAFGIHSPSTVMAEMGGFLIQGFLGGITDTWNKITVFLGNAFTELKNLIKGPINGILGFVNGLISGVVDGVNLIVRAMNKLKFDVPDWVPFLGGKTFGFNLPEVTAPQIPMLANGGVIKQPTLAMMGEYPSANTNPEIVAPQSVIADTVALAMEDMAASNIAGFEAVVSILREILEALLGIEIGDDVLGQAVERYNRKMAIARGRS